MRERDRAGRRRGWRSVVLAVVSAGLAAGPGGAVAAQDAGEVTAAVAVLRDAAGEEVGLVRLVAPLEGPGDEVRVAVEAEGFSPGFHGFHVHAVGSCVAPDFTSAGPHLNPGDADHGAHAGDLPFLRVRADGTARLTAATDAFTIDELLAGDGSAVIIHSGPDNLANIPDRYSSSEPGAPATGPDATTRATGDSGTRVACGVVAEGDAGGAGFGYWVAGTDGGVVARGDVPDLGGVDDLPLRAEVLGMAATAGGGGYWLASFDGGVFAFGDATFQGGMAGTPLNDGIVDIAAPAAHAVAPLLGPDGARVGTARLAESAGGVQVTVTAEGLTPGFHGFHVHTVGSCVGPDFTSAGGHWNPTGATHGAHASDLPVLLADAGGRATARFTVDAFRVADLFDDDGSALVVHAGRDNLAHVPDRYSSSAPDAPPSGPDPTTLATGDAGARAACGVVAPTSVARGDGYWLAAADGGVFAFGGVPFAGSMGGTPLNEPVVSLAATPTGQGYWLAAADGGVFAFGDAGFFGSTGGIDLVDAVVSVAATPSGQGYWLLGADGGIFAFGDAPFLGRPALGSDAVALDLTATPTGGGYWVVTDEGDVHAFGDAVDVGGRPPAAPGVAVAVAAP